MDPVALLLVALGLAIVVAGGEIVVRSASRLARLLGLSPVVIGLTVVAFGTSAPELAVSVGATLGGSTDVAVGNVVGSNIYNVLLILGLSAVVASLLVKQQIVRIDVPIVIAVSVLLWLLASDGTITRPEAALLFAGLVGYSLLALWIQHELRDELTTAMLFFVIPLTVLTLLVVLAAELRQRRAGVATAAP